MNRRMWMGMLCCVLPCLLIFTDFPTYVIRDVVKSFIKRSNAWPFTNISYRENMSLDVKSKTRRLHILLIAYFRSGSTFTGSMLDANSEMFYSFEPLHPLGQDLKKDKLTTTYLNGSKIDLKTKLVKRETIGNILHCKLSQLSKRVLKSMFWAIPRASKAYWKCFKESHAKLGDCVQALENVCLEKNVTVIKTIRFPLEEVEALLNTDGALKVLHLVRDPRPTLYSAKTWGYLGNQSLAETATKHCARIYTDVLVTKQLLKTRARDVKLVFYEDLVIDTKRVVQEIYDFIGKPFTREIEEHIKRLGAKDLNCFLCLGRTNATSQLNKWRMTMPYNDVQIIDSKCGMVYNEVGYKPANTEVILRDLNRHLREPLLSVN